MRCEHEAGTLEFGKIVDIDSERVKIAFKERCQNCNKIIDKGFLTYTRDD